MIFAGATWWGAPGAEAIAVRGGRVVAVGALRDLRAQAPGDRVVDLGGGFAVAGLTDAHGHLDLLGAAAEQIDLRGCTSAGEVAQRVGASPRRKGWVRGRGWSDARWPEPADSRSLAEHPGDALVLLERSDAHAVWVNDAVLRLAGITRETPDPSGGRIERRADGTPTGVLVDNAIALVDRLLPETTSEDLDRQLALAARRCAQAGLTSIHDAGLDADSWAGLLRLEARGELPLRVYGMARDAEPRADLLLSRGPVRTARLHLRAVKFFVDGALGSRGAAFFEPYADGQGGTGLLLHQRAGLAQRLARRMHQGFQVALHAIGDRANALALDAIADALAQTRARDARPRIEHAQHVRPRDLRRFGQLGVVASMQPLHHASDWSWARPRLGRERYAGAYAWRSMLREGVALAFGSDFPIESEDPRLGLQATIQRLVVDGEPEERLTPDEALRAFTLGPAHAAFEEHELGLFAPGYRADFTLFRRDPRLDARAPVEASFLDGVPAL